MGGRANSLNSSRVLVLEEKIRYLKEYLGEWLEENQDSPVVYATVSQTEQLIEELEEELSSLVD